MNGEDDERIRAALSNIQPPRSTITEALKGWQEETRTVGEISDGTLQHLIDQEIGGFLRLTMARYEKEARQDFSDQLLIEIAEVPLSLVQPALAAARRKLAYPERLVPFIFDFIEARMEKLATEGERLKKLADLASG